MKDFVPFIVSLIFLGIFIRYWRWWTIAVLIAGGINGWLCLAVLVIGFIAERGRRKKIEDQADLAGTTGAAKDGLREEPPNAQAHRADESLAQPSPKTQTDKRIIDINTARREELLTLPGIGAAEAGLILKYTQSGQGFDSLDELENHLRLKPHKIAQLRGKVCFSSRTAAGARYGGEAKDLPPPLRRGRVID